MPPRRALLVIILGAMAAFGPLATDMYLPAFPAIAASLPAEPAAVQRTLAAFFAGMAVAQLAYGPLADRFGRKPPLLAGLAIFTLASVGCALTRDIHWLTALRFCQGLGGCAGMVMARAVVRDVTEGAASVRLMSQLMLVMGVAPVLAPSLGGALLAAADWRAVFWVLAGYGAALALVVAAALPETLPPGRRRRDGPAQVLGVYARLLADRRFMGHALSGTLPMGGLFAYIAGSPFVFMDLHGVAPADYGLLFGANALGIMLAAQANAALARRLPAPRVLAATQWWMAAAGALLLLAALTGIGGIRAIAVALFLFVAGLGAVMPLATALAMAPQGRAAGSASALIGTLQFGGGALAAGLLGLLHDGTALPMAAVVAACGAGGPLARRLLLGR